MKFDEWVGVTRAGEMIGFTKQAASLAAKRGDIPVTVIAGRPLMKVGDVLAFRDRRGIKAR